MKTVPLIAGISAILVFTLLRVSGEESKITIPDSVKAIWAAVDAKYKQLTDVVAAKKADEVYTVAEDLEALLKALPSRSSNLPVDKRKRVEGQVKNAGKVLDDLHDAAKDGKYDVAQEKLKIVEGVIKAVRAQYPADETSP
jgi:hypothetical protein